jgi:hypothetical protein
VIPADAPAEAPADEDGAQASPEDAPS